MYLKRIFIFSLFVTISLHFCVLTLLLNHKTIANKIIQKHQIMHVELWYENNIKNTTETPKKKMHVVNNKMQSTSTSIQNIQPPYIKKNIINKDNQKLIPLSPVKTSILTTPIIKTTNKIKQAAKNTVDDVRQANLARLMQNTLLDKKLDTKENIQEISKENNHNNNENKNKGLSSAYKAKVQNIIKRHINYNANEKNIIAIVTIRIDANGNLLAKNLVKNSGDELWDKAALQAIEASEPFPAPENADTITITLHLKAE